MLRISKELFTAWNDAKVNYCHWKSNEHLLPGLNGQTDLDVLLSRNDKIKGESILRTLRFLQVKSQFGSRYPDVDDWIGFDDDTGELIHIHLHYNIVTGHKGMKEYSLPWTEMALNTCVFCEEYGVYTMEPDLEIVTLYTRIGLKANLKSLICCHIGKFHLSKDTLREVNWLKERVNEARVHTLLDSFYGDMATEIWEIMQKEEIGAPDFLRLRRITENRFKENRRVKCFVRVRELFYSFYQSRRKRVSSRSQPVITKKTPVSGKGIRIVFIGQDGSGKSTVTKEIVKWLSWKLDAKRFYFGSGDHFNPWQKKLRKGLKRFSRLPIISSLYKLSTLRVLSLWGTYICRTIDSVEKYVGKGGLAILDRFPQMQFVGINDGPKIRSWLLDNSGKFIGVLGQRYAKKEEKSIEYVWKHSPDVVFKLVLPVTESFRRKPMENKESIVKKHDVVERLLFEGSPVYTINAAQDYDSELLEIKQIIWSHLLES